MDRHTVTRVNNKRNTKSLIVLIKGNSCFPANSSRPGTQIQRLKHRHSHHIRYFWLAMSLETQLQSILYHLFTPPSLSSLPPPFPVLLHSSISVGRHYHVCDLERGPGLSATLRRLPECQMRALWDEDGLRHLLHVRTCGGVLLPAGRLALPAHRPRRPRAVPINARRGRCYAATSHGLVLHWFSFGRRLCNFYILRWPGLTPVVLICMPRVFLALLNSCSRPAPIVGFSITSVLDPSSLATW